MPVTVDYFLTPVSPFTYLGHERFRAIARARGAQVNLRVMDLGKVFPASGGLPLKDRAPQRRAYRMMELKRWRDALGMPLVLEPKHFPAPAEAPATLVLAVLEKHGADAALDVAGDCLRALWADDRDITAADTLRALADARGFDGDALLAQAKSAGVAALYVMHSQEAIARGVFGAPTYALGEELFWGQDRLDFLDRALAGAAQG
jgi:2-hydroxychromene-2-carboxylate isomerase